MLFRSSTIGHLTLMLNMHRGAIDTDIKEHGSTPEQKGNPYNKWKNRQQTGGSQGRGRGNANANANTKGNARMYAAQVNSTAANNAGNNVNRGGNSARTNTSQNRGVQNQNQNQNGYRAIPQYNNRGNWRGNSAPNYRGGNRGGRGGNNMGNRQSCSLCGKFSHPTRGCENMIGDDGVPLKLLPVQNTCTACPAHVNPRLHHPVSLCPYRPKGVFSQTGMR